MSFSSVADIFLHFLGSSWILAEDFIKRSIEMNSTLRYFAAFRGKCVSKMFCFLHKINTSNPKDKPEIESSPFEPLRHTFHLGTVSAFYL